MRRCLVGTGLLAAVLAIGACADPASPTDPTLAVDPAPAVVAETFSGTLPVGGSRFYSFSIPVFGNVKATLRSMSGGDVPADVIVNLAIGTPSGIGCSTGAATSVQATGDAGLTNEVSTTLAAGTHCAALSDPGNLGAPATFIVVIDHP